MIEIKEVTNETGMKDFVKFPFSIFRFQSTPALPSKRLLFLHELYQILDIVRHGVVRQEDPEQHGGVPQPGGRHTMHALERSEAA